MANATKEDIKALTAAINKLSGKAGGGGTSYDPSTMERSAQASRAIADAMDEALTHAERLNALQEGYNRLAGEIVDKEDQQRRIQDMITVKESLKRKYTLDSLHAADMNIAKSQIQLDADERNLAILKSQLDAAVLFNEEVRKNADMSPEILADAQAHLALLTHQVSEQEKNVDITRKFAQDMDDARQANEEVVSETETLLNMLNLSSSSWENSFFGRAEKMGFGNAMKAQAEVVTEALKPHNLFATLMENIFTQTILMVKALDQALAAFNKTTGAAGEMDAVFHETRTITASVGGNLETVSESITALYTGMTTFSNATKQTQTELAKFTVTMERAGVSTDTTAGLLDIMVSSLGMMADEAQASMTNMAMFADQINMPIGQVMDNLQASMPVLAKYGKEGVEVFKKVQAAAKATGIATQDLINITEQFDTFESAAESAGRLNAILGGNYLNSLQLVNMNEEERIRALLGVVDASGRSWNSMSRFERQAIASAAGIRDMDQANRLFGSGLAGYEEMLAKQEENADANARLAEIAKKAQSVFEKFTAVMEQLAVAVGPIIDGMHLFMNAVLALNEITGGAFVPVLMTLVGGYFLLSSALNGTIGKVYASIGANLAAIKTWAIKTFMVEGTTAATWKQIFAMNALGGAMVKAFGVMGLLIGAYMLLEEYLGPASTLLFVIAGAMFAYAAATMSARAAMGGLVMVVLTLIAALTEPNSPPFYLLLPIIAAGLMAIAIASPYVNAGLVALAAVAKAAAIPIMLLGIAFILLGAGLALIGLGFGLVVDAVLDLAKGMIELATAGGPAIANIMQLAISLPIIAVAGFGAMFGLLAFALGMGALGLSLKLVSTDDLEALATMFEGLGKTAEAGGGGMESALGFLNTLKDIADDIDEDSLKSISSIFSDLTMISEVGDMTSLTAFLASLSEVETEKLGALSGGLLKLGNAMMLFSLGTFFVPNTLNSIEVEKVMALNDLFDKMGNTSVDNVLRLAEAMEVLSETMNEMPAIAPLTVAMMFESLSDIGSDAPVALERLDKVLVTASELDDAKAAKIERVTESITDMVIELQGGLFTNTEAVKETLEALAKILGSPAGGDTASGDNRIILALDREGQKRLAEATLPHIESLLNKKYTTARVRQT
jgi:hypothetical protein